VRACGLLFIGSFVWYNIIPTVLLDVCGNELQERNRRRRTNGHLGNDDEGEIDACSGRVRKSASALFWPVVRV